MLIQKTKDGLFAIVDSESKRVLWLFHTMEEAILKRHALRKQACKP
jgi:hypothetical protein